MIKICKEERLCTGCTACANTCPMQAIQMQVNEEGFLYPVINSNVCIECKRCEKACPVNHKPGTTDYERTAYVARISDDILRMECSSGGVFTALALRFLKQRGIVYAAVYDSGMRVVHQRLASLADIKKVPGSKYVQSDLGNTFFQIREDICSGLSVLFCGTPCQVAGLVSFLGTIPEQLVVVDLVCHGVPSPKLWETYKENKQKKYGSLESANFRSKRFGYHVASMVEKYHSGKIFIGSARTNEMLKCFFKNVADRESCYDCQFKTVERCSDLTIFDSWHAAQLVPEIRDDDKGFTNIIVQSEKGERLIRSCVDSLLLFEADLMSAVKLDGKMATESVNRPALREVFYQELEVLGLSRTIDKYLPITKFDLVIEKTKVVLHKIGVAWIVKKIMKWF